MIAARQIFLGRGGGAKLPYDAEVEYLESTGGQYGQYIILPDVVMNPLSFGTHVRCVFYNDVSGVTTLYGTLGPTWTPDGYCFTIGGNYRNSFLGSNKNWRAGDEYAISGSRGNVGQMSDVSITNLGDWDGSRMTMRIRSPLVNEDVVFDRPYPSTVVGNVAVFGCYYGGKANEIPHARIYQLQLLNYSQPFVDLNPVRFTNEQDVSEGALYDRVSGQLFRNQGSGSFLIGPDKEASRTNVVDVVVSPEVR